MNNHNSASRINGQKGGRPKDPLVARRQEAKRKLRELRNKTKESFVQKLEAEVIKQTLYRLYLIDLEISRRQKNNPET